MEPPPTYQDFETLTECTSCKMTKVCELVPAGGSMKYQCNACAFQIRARREFVTARGDHYTPRTLFMNCTKCSALDECYDVYPTGLRGCVTVCGLCAHEIFKANESRTMRGTSKIKCSMCKETGPHRKSDAPVTKGGRSGRTRGFRYCPTCANAKFCSVVIPITNGVE